MNPIDSPFAYHHFKIGSVPSPGIVVSISGWKPKWGWKENKGKGTKKATRTHTGQELQSGSFTVHMWEPQHFIDWQDFVKIIGYDTDKKPAGALKLYYPNVTVTDVVTEDYTPYTHKGKGLYESVFSFGEWSPEPKKNATVTPKGPTSPNSVTGRFPPSDDPVGDAQQKRIAELLAQARKP